MGCLFSRFFPGLHGAGRWLYSVVDRRVAWFRIWVREIPVAASIPKPHPSPLARWQHGDRARGDTPGRINAVVGSRPDAQFAPFGPSVSSLRLARPADAPGW